MSKCDGSHYAFSNYNKSTYASDYDYNSYYDYRSTPTSIIVAAYYQQGGGGQFTLSSWRSHLSYLSTAGKASHSISGDPLFNDEVNDDLTLQSESPCINAGVDLQSEIEGWGIEGVEWKAIDGTARDANPDMGAYEYVSGGVTKWMIMR